MQKEKTTRMYRYMGMTTPLLLALFAYTRSPVEGPVILKAGIYFLYSAPPALAALYTLEPRPYSKQGRRWTVTGCAFTVALIIAMLNTDIESERIVYLVIIAAVNALLVLQKFVMLNRKK